MNYAVKTRGGFCKWHSHYAGGYKITNLKSSQILLVYYWPSTMTSVDRTQNGGAHKAK